MNQKFYLLTNNLKMKKIAILIFTIVIWSLKCTSQTTKSIEKYGKTLNTGIGIGYYGTVGKKMPVLHFDYEIDIIKNLTLAPSVSFFTYQKYENWGNPFYTYKDYRYRQTVVPIGIKGTYYFDDLVKINAKWDIYLASSLGFKIIKTSWESDYQGSKTTRDEISRIYLDLHIGSEYHLKEKIGLFIDLSTGVSTFGLAIHL